MSEWLTWRQAADLVGCPVPTIDWYKRQGRIRHREGRLPSLERESVEEFAEWWQERQRRPQKPRPPRPEQPDPSKWATPAEAAELLGCSPGHVGHLARSGDLQAQKVGGRLWVERASLQGLADERAQWISRMDAAELVGCSHETIGRAVQSGQIERRDQPGTASPSLRRSSVEEFGRRWHAERVEAERRRAERPRAGGPPDDEHVWLPVEVVALMLGLSVRGVRYRVRRGYLPHERHGGRLWFRRDHVEQIAAARRFG